MRVQQVDGEFRVVLTAEAVEALHLTEGSEVEVRAVGSADIPDRLYISVEEGLESFRRTEPKHKNAYRELAK